MPTPTPLDYWRVNNVALMNARTFAEGQAILVELGYTKCEPQHVQEQKTHACYRKISEHGDSHVCVCKRGSRIELVPVGGEW
jgi:hypothetical protein